MDGTTAMKMEYLRILKELHRETALDTNKQMERVCKSIEEDLGITEEEEAGLAVKVRIDTTELPEGIQRIRDAFAKVGA